MQEKRRRKKSRFGYYLYAFVVLVLTIANVTLAILLLTHVQKINVSGTKIASQTEIQEWVQEDPLTVNSLYTFFKFKAGRYELPVYLEDVKVSLSLPWEVQVQVDEKDIIACIPNNGKYVYIDKDGLVMKISAELDAGMSCVEGVNVQRAEQFKVLKIKEEKLTSYIEDIIYEIKRNEIAPDRITWEDDSMNLYFGEVCVELGKMNYDVKIAELPPILESLEGKAGVLRMEHYSETNDSISFEGQVEPVPEEPGEEQAEEPIEEPSEEIKEEAEER